jgi:hypothetical protein
VYKWARFIPIVAIIVSALIYWSITEPRDRRKEERDLAGEERSAAEFTPIIEVGIYVAYSPDLTDEEDMGIMERAGIDKARVITTPYQQNSLNQYTPKSNVRFLFVLFRNQGNKKGSIEIHIKQWLPKNGQTRPAGVDDIPELGVLNNGEAYALLIDAAEGMDEFSPLRLSNVKDAYIEYTFSDLTGEIYSPAGIWLSQMGLVFDLIP